MFKSITRQEMFTSSVFADNLVAIFQQSYISNIVLSLKAEVNMLKKYYDHLKPFQPIESPINSHCVLAYAVLTPIKQEYSFKFRLLIKRLIFSL
jgi:hypothetical protein